MGSHWYETFFRGLALQVWSAMRTPQQTQNEVDFLVSKLGLAPGATVLDVPCGNGRHATELARRGYRVRAIDIAEEYILAGREQSSAVEFTCGDMRQLALGAQFDGAYCLGNSFGYMDDDANREFLLEIGRSLRPGARFVLDTSLVAEAILPDFQQREWQQLGRMFYLSNASYDAQQSCVRLDHIFIKGDQIQTAEATFAIYTVAELVRMLKAGGLRPIEMLGSTDGAPFAIGHTRLLLVAEAASRP
jgi:SAM-dependent methyltransferase